MSASVSDPPPIPAGLHAFTGVAELKRVRGAGDGHRAGGLHAFTGVAELKHAVAGDAVIDQREVSTPSPAWPN